MIGLLRRHPLPFILTGLAVTGAAISGYLAYVHLADKPVICGGQASCATVQSSEYASVGGVPIAQIGLVFYLVAAILATQVDVRPVALPALFGLALGGVVYSAYLTWVEVAVLEAICFWCVASAVVVTLIALVAGWAALRATAAPARPAGVRRQSFG